MPAITVGLSEIEERLRALRRRLNLLTLQHGVYLGGSVIVLVSTGLIVVGLRASATTFRIAAWGAAGVALGVAAACVVFLRLRWLDEQGTAHLVDRRAELTDRLATIVTLRLRLRPRTSRLVPVLIAQTLGLGARWQAQQIAPRPVPRSIFMLLAALLALASTVLIARHEPRAASPADPVGRAAGSVDEAAIQEPSQPGAPSLIAGEPAGGDSSAQSPMNSLPGAQPLGPGTTAANAPLDLPNQPKASTALTSLPDRLQEAIRHAFHAEAVDKPRELAMRPESRTDDSPAGRDHSADSDAQPRSPEDKGTFEKGGQQPSAGRRNEQPKRPEQSESSERVAQRQESTPPDQRLDGHAPAAGDGSSPSSLMDPKAAGLARGAEGRKTFKLTINSFLRAAEQQGNQPREPGKGAGATGNAGTASSGGVAPSDRQLSDDALRKAEVPPEYEDIVRRVYSARASQ